MTDTAAIQRLRERLPEFPQSDSIVVQRADVVALLAAHAVLVERGRVLEEVLGAARPVVIDWLSAQQMRGFNLLALQRAVHAADGRDTSAFGETGAEMRARYAAPSPAAPPEAVE